MAKTDLRRVLQQLHPPGGGPSDGQLLSRFLAARDEASFAALVRRHGPMVLGVCRRLLGNVHDAEDAFQATFLVLARRAGSVVKRESVGCWLHGVACRTALQARAANGRRRARERQVENMPHPEVPPEEVPDWLPLLDRELGRLPEKYRSAVVLCDLEGRTRGEAARQLGLPEGTLSGRLTTARRLLARRLARHGLAPAGGVAAVFAHGRAPAQVPAALVWSTARAGALVAAGQLAAAPGPAVVLMKGVFKTMFLTKLKLAAGVAVVLAAVTAGGVAYQAGAVPGVVRAAAAERPANELDALRRENELLKLNLEVVLEKVRAQEAELRGLRGRHAETGTMISGGGSLPGSGSAMGGAVPGMAGDAGVRVPAGPGMRMMGGPAPGMGSGPGTPPAGGPGMGLPGGPNPGGKGPEPMGGPMPSPQPGMGPMMSAPRDPVREAESAVKALRDAHDEKAKQEATRALERALQLLKEGNQPGGAVANPSRP